MPRRTWSGRKVTTAIRWVTTRDHGICGICDHPGATSLDHVKPYATHPHLEWEPTNWQAVHLNPAGHTQPDGTPDGCTHPDCHCPGNVGRGVIPLPIIRAVVHEANARTQPTQSRDW